MFITGPIIAGCAWIITGDEDKAEEIAFGKLVKIQDWLDKQINE